ncbi:MAG TPA: cupin domain-containing protein [Rugosimonospora sp.]|nr:cupin domain-containing protein [Rugosimonospora sp.]
MTNRTEESRPVGRLPAALDHLLAPVTVATFVSEYWEKQPLLIQRNQPEYYKEILTLEDVDHVLANSSLNDHELRLVADGEETTLNELLPGTVEGRINGVEALFDRYRSGATVNLMFLNERWPPLSRLCRTLASELSAGIHANVYLTPPGTRGLTPHHDTHDVLVLHLFGTKHWTYYPTQTRLPLTSQHYVMPAEGAGEPIQEFELRPGDLAYLPRGTVHAARANEAASLHLTIGINPMVWATVVRSAMEQVFARDTRFRESVPIGFVTSEEVREASATWLRELFGIAAAGAHAAEAIDQAASRMLQRRHPTLGGHLLDLQRLPSVGLTTRLRRRPDLQYRLTSDDEQIHIEFHGKVIDLPEYVEDEFAFIAKVNDFVGAEIPGQLDDEGRLVLIRQLLREGFLTSA